MNELMNVTSSTKTTDFPYLFTYLFIYCIYLCIYIYVYILLPWVSGSLPKECMPMKTVTFGMVERFETICAMVKSRYIGDGHPTFNRNPYNGYINLYYWVDDHPLLYGNN